jgi:Flp pilus assembly protein TadD
VGVVIWAYWSVRGSRKVRAACIGAFGLGILLVIAPVSLRNYHVEGKLVIVSANGGVNFYIGNGPGATGTFRVVEEHEITPGDITGRFAAQEAEGRALTLAEVSDWWFSEAWSYIRKKPWIFIRNWIWKIYLFWDAFEIPQLEWYGAERKYSPVLRLPLVSSHLVIPLALIGLVLSAQQFRRVGILHLYVVMQTIITSLFFVTGRYRLTVLPVLAIFAAYALLHFLREWRQQRVGTVLGMLAAFVFLFWATSPSRLSLNMREIERWHATILALRHSRTESGLELARSILAHVTEEHPESAESHRFYGEVLRKSGDFDAADRELRRAWTLRPNAVVLLELGELYSEAGNDSLAVKAYKDAITLAPFLKEAHEKLAFAYVKIGKTNMAIDEFNNALANDPADASLRVNLGVTYGELGMSDEALRQFGLALQYDDSNWKARYNLAAALAELGKQDSARFHLEAILEQDPGNETARRALSRLGQ